MAPSHFQFQGNNLAIHVAGSSGKGEPSALVDIVESTVKNLEFADFSMRR